MFPSGYAPPTRPSRRELSAAVRICRILSLAQWRTARQNILQVGQPNPIPLDSNGGTGVPARQRFFWTGTEARPTGERDERRLEASGNAICGNNGMNPIRRRRWSDEKVNAGPVEYCETKPICRCGIAVHRQQPDDCVGLRGKARNKASALRRGRGSLGFIPFPWRCFNGSSGEITKQTLPFVSARGRLDRTKPIDLSH